MTHQGVRADWLHLQAFSSRRFGILRGNSRVLDFLLDFVSKASFPASDSFQVLLEYSLECLMKQEAILLRV